MKNNILAVLNILVLCAFVFFAGKNKRRIFKFRDLKKGKRNLSSEIIINTLCYNNYEGRRVGSRGNEKAADYIKMIFEDIGLSTYCDDTYYEEYNQNVVLKESEEDAEGEVTNKTVKNVVGLLEGRNKNSAVVVSAHFDSIGSINSRIIKGALDNASGIAVVVKLAEELKKNKPLKKDIIFACFNGEETGLQGSSYFVEHIKGKYSNLYNINIDCVGGKNAGEISLENNSKISIKLTDYMKRCFTENNLEFSDTIHSDGISDHKSFEDAGIPNIYIGQDKAKLYIHNYYDTPDSINYNEADKLALCICDFLIKNDNINF
ncbi:MAG: M28 family peptidase [Clostridium sp.]|nr:M28 family peptidase [Clostridium sp.]